MEISESKSNPIPFPSAQYTYIYTSIYPFSFTASLKHTKVSLLPVLEMDSSARSFLLLSLFCFFNGLLLSEALKINFHRKDALLVDNVCKQAQVGSLYDFCIQSLSSDPRALSSDLPGLLRVGLEFAMKNATDTLVSMDDLARATTEDNTLQFYMFKCLDYYGEIISSIQSALEDLGNAAAHQDLRSKVTDATAQANACPTSFSGPPARQDPLAENNQKLINLCTVVSAIVDLLGN